MLQVSDIVRVSASEGGEVNIVGRQEGLSRDLSGGSSLAFE